MTKSYLIQSSLIKKDRVIIIGNLVIISGKSNGARSLFVVQQKLILYK